MAVKYLAQKTENISVVFDMQNSKTDCLDLRALLLISCSAKN